MYHPEITYDKGNERASSNFRELLVWAAETCYARKHKCRVVCDMENTMTRDEILRKLDENREIIRGFGVRRLGIFGSYVRGEQSEASDIDFLVEFEQADFQ